MIADNLRKALLQSAIQGKLTEQLLQDGTISTSIARQISVDYTFNKNDKYMFDIPDTWLWVKLKDVCIIKNGSTPRKSDFNNWNSNDVPWFTVKDIHIQGRFINHTQQFITHKALGNGNRLIPKNSILLCCTASLGEFAMTNIDLTTNQQFNGITIKEFVQDLIDPIYIYYWVQTIKEQMEDKAGKTTFPFLSTKKLGEFLFPFPPLAEQKRIVEKLNTVLPMINDTKSDETKLQKLMKLFPDKMKKSIIQDALQGKLTEQLKEDGDAKDLLNNIQETKREMISSKQLKKVELNTKIIADDILFELPSNWTWTSLNSISKLITDGTHKTPNYITHGVPFLSVQNISSGSFNFNRLKHITKEEHDWINSRCNPENGDILLCRIGTLGKPIIIDLDFDFSIFVSLALIKLIDNNLNEYIKIVLSSPLFDDWMRNYKVGGGTHTNKLNLRDMNHIPIPLPPLAEQRRIVEILNKMLPLIDNLSK